MTAAAAGKGLSPVMAGHSRPKDGVASLAYVPAIHVLLDRAKKDVDARHKSLHSGPAEGGDPGAGHDGVGRCRGCQPLATAGAVSAIIQSR